jgi:hypothetical protein
VRGMRRGTTLLLFGEGAALAVSGGAEDVVGTVALTVTVAEGGNWPSAWASSNRWSSALSASAILVASGRQHK